MGLRSDARFVILNTVDVLEENASERSGGHGGNSEGLTESEPRAKRKDIHIDPLLEGDKDESVIDDLSKGRTHIVPAEVSQPTSWTWAI